MIDEAIEQLEPEERRIIERIRSMPDLDLQFKDFESDPVQNLRDLVKIWREIHPEDVEDKQKIPNVTSDSPELKKKLKVDDHTIDRELILSHLDEIERRLGAIERHLALITGFGLEELLLLRRLKERPEIISLLMEQLRQGLEK
ncbi:MAG: hypothetical protein HSCHL_1387 [Hydrogenibacillus schlegelii]|uniref:Uncharacterized protein n=2 Tax=Hydrogenibacillus schlegelii TaxID=1484 RepID=A0A2T5G4P5_HYDSH|nr:MAG: hypothetical protein HSCHL_1387 [Hydrogenibacillus schlegelii]